MCLIVVKPAGTPFPKSKKLRQWFKDHPNGFGLAFPEEDKVRILKGALTEGEMLELINKMHQILSLKGTRAADVNVLLHFRIATGSKVCAENCHPFPITAEQNKLASLDTLTDFALAHNGIIYQQATSWQLIEGKWAQPKTDKTDTQEFIENFLVTMTDLLEREGVQNLIEGYTNSKFAILTPRKFILIGDFLKDNGRLFSNGGYRETTQHPGRTYYTPPESAGPWADFVESTEGEKSSMAFDQRGNISHLCDWCQAYYEEVYLLPDDNVTLLCFSDFRQFTGRNPTEAERWCC